MRRPNSPLGGPCVFCTVTIALELMWVPAEMQSKDKVVCRVRVETLRLAGVHGNDKRQRERSRGVVPPLAFDKIYIFL